jgi:hypothetical protein
MSASTPRPPSRPRPSCGKENNGSTFTPVLSGEVIAESDGDYSVCFYCGAICIFADNATRLRLLTAEDLRRLETDPEFADLNAKLLTIQKAVLLYQGPITAYYSGMLHGLRKRARK